MNSLTSNVCPSDTFLQGRIARATTHARQNTKLAASYHFGAAELRLALAEHRSSCTVCKAAAEAKDESSPHLTSPMAGMAAVPYLPAVAS